MRVQIANTWLIPTLPLSITSMKQCFVSKVFISKTRKGGLFSFEALRNQVSRIKGVDSLIIDVASSNYRYSLFLCHKLNVHNKNVPAKLHFFSQLYSFIRKLFVYLRSKVIENRMFNPMKVTRIQISIEWFRIFYEKNKMKKNLCGLFVVIIVSMFFSCGGDDDSGHESPKMDPNDIWSFIPATSNRSEYSEVNDVLYHRSSGSASIAEIFAISNKLTSFDIPETIEIDGNTYKVAIPEGGFLNGSALQRLSIPSSIKEIPNGGCQTLLALTTVNIGSGIIKIGESAFANCISLREIVIPESVKTIGGSAFLECKSLQQITLPAELNAIEEFLFFNCTSLATVNFPEHIKKIGTNAFAGCSNLAVTKIDIPNGVSEIGQEAFRDCSKMESVTISNSVKTIGSLAFYGCSNLSFLSIGSGVTEFGQQAFNECPNLKTLVMNNAYFSQAYWDYFAPNNITDLTVGDDVTEFIGDFPYSTWMIERLTLGKNLKSLRRGTFSNCIGLKDIFSLAETVPVDEGAFEGVDYAHVILHVPALALATYQKEWSQFVNIVAL